jgi:hypothetical protein
MAILPKEMYMFSTGGRRGGGGVGGAGSWQPGRPMELRPGWLVGGQQPTCSFSVSWCGEAFHGLRVQGAEVSAPWNFSQAYLQHLSKVPDSRSSHSLHLCPSHHFGSSQNVSLNQSYPSPLSSHCLTISCTWLKASRKCGLLMQIDFPVSHYGPAGLGCGCIFGFPSLVELWIVFCISLLPFSFSFFCCCCYLFFGFFFCFAITSFTITNGLPFFLPHNIVYWLFSFTES